jgi:hypothetical protein
MTRQCLKAQQKKQLDITMIQVGAQAKFQINPWLQKYNVYV